MQINRNDYSILRLRHSASIVVLPLTAIVESSTISTTYYYHWVQTSAGGLLVPEGDIRPVVSVSALT